MSSELMSCGLKSGGLMSGGLKSYDIFWPTQCLAPSTFSRSQCSVICWGNENPQLHLTPCFFCYGFEIAVLFGVYSRFAPKYPLGKLGLCLGLKGQ